MKISITENIVRFTLLSLFLQTSAIAGMAEYVAVKSSYVGSSTSLGGTVIPHREVNLVAKMPGDIVFIAGEEGDEFKKGDDLARQDIDALL
ncbi:MAG: hypothetical protein E3I13_04720, partial [Gammaproteobacteria bacterium]